MAFNELDEGNPGWATRERREHDSMCPMCKSERQQSQRSCNHGIGNVKIREISSQNRVCAKITSCLPFQIIDYSPRMAEKQQPTKVWLIEDNGPYRRTVARLINKLEGLTCAGEFGSAEESFRRLVMGDKPDVILLDVGLPGMSGLDAIGRIRKEVPNCRIVILSAFEDDDKIMKAICAGASGYLLKSADQAQITAAIQDVLSGGAPINPRIAKRVLELFAGMAPPEAKDYGLTPRERQILERMVDGRIKKEIASDLDMNYHTVDAHIRSIYSKLEVHTRAGAVAKALKENLL
jgi:DNA-binding NarL/FixJ family response regulator